ncbi:MAG: glycoside hydrolase family 127 protein, partial [Lewinella sp.]|nr:glycoside hydrolase family 127 protein [Lewinella sp.]
MPKAITCFRNLCCLLLLLSSCTSEPITAPKEAVRSVEAFPLTEVRLLEGPFQHATELNIRSLLQYEPDRLLAMFRTEAGLEPKAEHYEGWEAETIAGHSLGHHLSACALMYQSTNDNRFLERVNYIVDELETVQNANGNGYVGAFKNGKKIFEEEIAQGNIRSQGFDLNGIWAPFYTHHKVLAGLRDAYRLCGNEKALEVGKKFGLWIGSIVEGLTHEQVQQMLHCEFGGVQETLADLYADTEDEHFLKIARIFHDDAIVDPLANGEDILPGKHGNTQIPKMIASARLYELTGSEEDRKPAEFFWNTVAHHHSYVTGGHGNHEYFGKPDQLTNRLSDETTETCNVYNMLKLSRHLFFWEPSAEIADYYERALFNHILASQHPETGRVIYNLSLEMGGFKIYQDPEWFTCCVGSGMETHSKYGANIYYHNEDELYVSQYLASRLNWEEKGLTLEQHTAYPEEQGSSFRFELSEPQTFTLYLRYPHWSEKGINISINGEAQTVAAEPGTFLALKRQWENGDEVRVDIPFNLRLEEMPDDEDRIAVFYGPVLLAGDLGPVDDEAAHTPEFVPVFMSEERSPEAWLKPVKGQINTFETDSVGRPRDVVFKPFYQTHDRRYSVYFDLFNQERWETRQEAYEAERQRKKELEAMTFDAFQPGE